MPEKFAAKAVLADGFHTTYIEAGDPSRQTIVLIHDGGYGTTAELCWGGVIPVLAEQFHVVAPDLLGWGGTDKAIFFDRSPYAPRLRHIAAFCEALQIEDAHFVGASFGGSMVMRAVCDPVNPWPLNRAVSISGTGGPFRLPEGIAALADYTPSMEDAKKMTALIVRSTEGLEDHIRARYENSLIPGHWEAMAAARLRNPAVKRELPPDPYLEQLAHVRKPVLLIHGRHDPLLETGWAKTLADLSPTITETEVDYSHEPNIDAPQLTAGLIVDFFADGDIA